MTIGVFGKTVFNRAVHSIPDMRDSRSSSLNPRVRYMISPAGVASSAAPSPVSCLKWMPYSACRNHRSINLKSIPGYT